jgi:prepilin-type N-terminal cleavage/methylation domain-containing protein
VTSFRHAGFTLLEICIALIIAAMLVALATPGIAGLLAERRLKQSFERFDAMVTEARRLSITERRAYTLVWATDSISLTSTGEAAGGNAAHFEFAKDESFRLRRPAALSPDATAEWTFWPSGLCEPAQIAFQGEAGKWLVQYDPLTTRGTFLESSVP